MKTNEKGFTLVEMMVSIAVLGILAAAIIGLFTSVMSGVSGRGSRDEALATASSIIERLYSESEEKTGLTEEEIIDFLTDRDALQVTVEDELTK